MFRSVDAGKCLLRYFALAAVLSPVPAGAVDLSVNGLADFRAVTAPRERDWFDGGLGKTRFGGSDRDAAQSLSLGELALTAQLDLTDEFSLSGYLRSSSTQQNVVDFVEAYARWRPAFAGNALTVKAGAFFQPGSLESFPPLTLKGSADGQRGGWTLTPSAVNSWISEEVKTIGLEARYRLDVAGDQIELTGAVFGWNDPAGILIAYRGWALHEHWGALLDSHRLPDEIPLHSGGRPPVKVEIFKEIDDRPGWYAGAAWQHQGWPRVSLLRYDNNADLSARRGQAAWRTRYWNFGVDTTLPGDVAVLAQLVTGDTIIAPNPAGRSVTEYQAGYILIGKDIENWRLAGRIDLFSTQERGPVNRAEFSENGRAITLAATRRLSAFASVTGEVLRVSSYRRQRLDVNVPARQTGTQAQVSLRFWF